ncbi:hypothetical protein FD754_024524 [Muntiacus muntjak]|uniref:Neugrin n=1 Tax=Muntiacus muntjak TaxID=9888 RepID=A0A5N3UP75_MUNMU|nr:hypothetical protein FD754_024524 [Muntiacus muntjak]
MAFSLKGFLGGRVCAAVARCGREPDPDFDWEPEERELQEVESALKRQKKAIRSQKIRRQMEASGAPPRSLTWEAMEQIRLAEGFDISTDVIRRVLKSKFVPTLEQKLKQDQKILKKIGFGRLFPELPGPGDSSKPLSAGMSVSGSLLMPGDEASSKGDGHSTALKAVELNTQSTNIPTRQTERNKGVQGLEEGKNFVPVAATHPTDTCRGTRGIDSDGLPSDKKLEELKAGEAGDQISNRVVQRGREFFDSNGNFLYRI